MLAMQMMADISLSMVILFEVSQPHGVPATHHTSMILVVWGSPIVLRACLGYQTPGKAENYHGFTLAERPAKVEVSRFKIYMVILIIDDNCIHKHEL